MGANLLIWINRILSGIFIANCTFATEIPTEFHKIAQEYNIPVEVLYAVSLTESPKKIAGKIIPHPWTLNVEGHSYYYKNRESACNALSQFVKNVPLKRIDVGIAQVNIGWNAQYHFKHYCDGFDVVDNLRLASSILKYCYNVHNDWLKAAGCYHRPKGGSPAIRYQSVIARHLSYLNADYLVTNQDYLNTVQWINPDKINWIEPQIVKWVYP